MISIVVPIYNVEKDLEKCIQSILNQSFTDFELLLINDGSTDLSLSICNSFVIENSNIIVLSQENSGVSSARNLGIRCAKGEYICFVDADDWLEGDFLKVLHDAMVKSGADLVISNFNNIKIGGYRKAPPLPFSQIVGSPIVPNDLFFGDKFVLGNPPYCKLFKTSLIKGGGVLFNKDLRNGEDFIFVLEYALLCNVIQYVDDYSYNYNRLSESSVTSKYFKEYYTNVKKTKDAYFRILERYAKVSDDEKLYQYFRVVYKAILEEGKPNNGNSFSDRRNNIRILLNLPEIREYSKRYSRVQNKESFTRKLLQTLIVLNLSFVLTCCLTIYYKLYA